MCALTALWRWWCACEGAAYKDLKPVVEFMTFNFSLQAIDQVKEASRRHSAHDVGRGSSAEHQEALRPRWSVKGRVVRPQEALCSHSHDGQWMVEWRGDVPTV
jgi:hypothetical protein